MSFIQKHTKNVLDYFAERIAVRVAAQLSPEIIERLERSIPPMLQNVATTSPSKPTPLVVDRDATHFYVHTSDGHRCFLDATDYHISLHVMEHGCWEDHVRHVMMQILKPGSTFVDVGGNVGLHSLFAGSIVGRTGKVIVFEPLPHMFQTLKLNIDINGMNGIVMPHQMAVSDEISVQSFSNFRTHPAMSGFTVPDARLQQFNDTTNSSVEIIEVKTTTLDEVLSGASVDAIKIDVEGYETLVIRGAHEVIRHNPHVKLIIEWDPPLTKSTLGDQSMAEMISFLRSENFHPYLALWGKQLEKISWDDAPNVSGDLVVSRTPFLN